jgi:DNA repair protein RadD
MNIISVLVRLGTKRLTDLVGRESINLLHELGEKNLGSSNLAKLLISQIGGEGVILNDKARKFLLESLDKSESAALEEELRKNGEQKKLSDIVNQKIIKKSNFFKTICGYFDIKLEDELHDEPEPEKTIDCQYPLFEHQRDAATKCYDILKDIRKGRVVLHMPTGAGKTRTAMHVISLFFRNELRKKGLICWLANTEELCEQAAKEFEISWGKMGDRSLKIYRHFSNNTVDFNGNEHGLLVTSFQKLQKNRKEEVLIKKISQNVELVVLDEAHSAIAATYCDTLVSLTQKKVPNVPIMGLTATPGRGQHQKDKNDPTIDLANFFRRNIVSLKVDGFNNPVNYLVKEKYLAEIEFINIDLTKSDFNSINLKKGNEKLKSLEEDMDRNLKILSIIKKEAKNEDNKIILFAASVRHAKFLNSFLKMIGIKTGLILSDQEQTFRRQIIDSYKNTKDIQVLINFNILTTGFDAPKTNVAVIARPTSSVLLYSQMVGRAARGERVGGNKTCKVYSVIDNIKDFIGPEKGFMYWEDLWK